MAAICFTVLLFWILALQSADIATSKFAGPLLNIRRNLLLWNLRMKTKKLLSMVHRLEKENYPLLPLRHSDIDDDDNVEDKPVKKKTSKKSSKKSKNEKNSEVQEKTTVLVHSVPDISPYFYYLDAPFYYVPNYPLYNSYHPHHYYMPTSY